MWVFDINSFNNGTLQITIVISVQVSSLFAFLVVKLEKSNYPYGLQWQDTIFKTIYGLDNIYDCLNYCLNIETGYCHLFTSQYGNCYLGNFDVTNGTHNIEPNVPLNGTVFTMKSNNFEFFNTSLFFYIYEQILKLLIYFF